MKSITLILITILSTAAIAAPDVISSGHSKIYQYDDGTSTRVICLSELNENQEPVSRYKEYKCAVNGVFSKASSDWLSDQDAAIEQARYRCLRTASQQERFFCNTVSAQCKTR